MPLYEVEYSDQKWIKVEKDESYNVVYKIPYSSIKEGTNCPKIENNFIVYILQGITTESKDYIYVGKSTKDGKPIFDTCHPSKAGAKSYGEAFIKDAKDRKLAIAAIFK